VSPRNILLALLLCLAPALAQDDESCLECHSDRAKLEEARKDKARPVDALFVDREAWKRSVHASRGCGECHFDYDQTPHPKDAETVQCADCHEDQSKALATSVHGQAKEGEPRLPAACKDCHGLHDITRSTEEHSHLYPLNVARTCGKCHFATDPDALPNRELLHEKYVGDVHGRGILRDGLVVSATCVSCHGGHQIVDVQAEGSPVRRTHIAQVCGKCHVGILQDYEKSIHYEKLNDDGNKGATCTDCHLPHQIGVTDEGFRLQSIKSCSNCHTERGVTFRETYHGKISALGFEGRVATCGSCHGNHTILPASNPESHVNKKNIVATCQQCHKEAQESFASYMVHADPRDGVRYPRVHFVYVLMNTILISVLILGGAHALLWLIRSLAAGEWRRPKRTKEETRYLRRWPRSYSAYHVSLMSTVLLLATTGIPLHYAEKPWAARIMDFFGGPPVAGYLHRASAIGLMILTAIFCLDIVVRRVVKRDKDMFRPCNTMLPRWKDVQDLVGNLRWFLFLAPRPKYDRWTYWEKFDFWAAFWGLCVIGVTGLMLWFPEHATRYVPGWFLNAAVVIHGIEALLDIAFIFTVHVFHANLRPDKFPMDTMFWTGRLTEEEFRHERPLEYERRLADGSLDALVDRAPWKRTRIVAYVIGTCALAVGFFFVAMMIVAVLQNGR